MKKTILAVLALATALSFTACSKDNSTDEKDNKPAENQTVKEVSNTDKAEDTVDKFFSSLLALEFDDCKKYIDDFDALDIDFDEFSSISDYKETVMKELPDELADYEDDFGSLFDNLIDEILDTMDYEILSSEEDGDNVAVEVKITVPEDTDNIEDKISENLESSLNDIIEEMLNDGTITEDMSEDDLMKAIVPKVIDVMNDSISANIKNLKTTTQTIDVVVYENDNGEWIINADETGTLK